MKYRKKPVVIEAWFARMLLYAAQQNWEALPQVVRDAYDKGDVVFRNEGIDLHTLEGWVLAQPADLVICGVAQELYPCRADIFAKTYEPAE